MMNDGIISLGQQDVTDVAKTIITISNVCCIYLYEFGSEKR
jgi:hypothetical protein